MVHFMRADLTRSALLLSLTVCAVSLDLKPNADGCTGSNNGNCEPNVMWSGTLNGSGYYGYLLNSGTFKASTYFSTTFAESVRCVLGFENIKTNQDYQTLEPLVCF